MAISRNLQPEKTTGKQYDKIACRNIESSFDYAINEVHPTWKRWRAIYEGNHWQAFGDRYMSSGGKSAAKPADAITVNRLGNHADRMMSYLLGNDFRINVKGKKPQNATAAILQEEIINDVWQRDDCFSQIEDAVLDCVTLGIGFVRVWFTRELDEALLNDKQQAITYEDAIVSEDAFIECVSPFHVIWDIHSPNGKMSTSRWAGRAFYKDPRDVVQNPIYDQDVVGRIKTGDLHPQNVNVPNQSSRYGYNYYDNWTDSKDKWCLVEYFDKKFRTRKIYVVGIDEPILSRPWWPHMKTFPIVEFPYIKSRVNPFNIGMFKWSEDLQYEQDRSRTLMFKHRRIHTARTLYDTAKVDDITQFQEGDDVIGVKGPLDQAIGPMRVQDIPEHEYKINGIISQEMDEATYINDVLQGASLGDRVSAQESQQRGQFSLTVVSKKKERIQRAIKSTISMMLANIKAFYTKPQVIEITGPNGNYWGQVTGDEPDAEGRYWVDYTPDLIMAETEVELDIEPDAPSNPQMDRQQDLLEFQNVTNPSVVPLLQQSGFDFTAFFTGYFRKYGRADAARYMHGVNVAEMPLAPPQTEYDMQQQQQQQPPGMMPPGAPPQQPGIPQLPANPQAAAMQQGSASPVSSALAPLVGLLGGSNGAQ